MTSNSSPNTVATLRADQLPETLVPVLEVRGAAGRIPVKRGFGLAFSADSISTVEARSEGLVQTVSIDPAQLVFDAVAGN